MVESLPNVIVTVDANHICSFSGLSSFNVFCLFFQDEGRS